MNVLNSNNVKSECFSTILSTVGAAVLATTITALAATNTYAASDSMVSNDVAGNSSANVQTEAQSDTNLIIYRDEGLRTNSKMYYRVYVDGEYMGKLKRNTAFHMNLTPGTHLVETNDPEQQSIEVNVSVDNVSYVSAEIDRHYGVTITGAQPAPAVAMQLSSCDASYNHRCESSSASCCADSVDNDRFASR